MDRIEETDRELDVPINEGRRLTEGRLTGKWTGTSGRLTKRQVQVIRLHSNGYEALQIAKALGMSRRTVDWHMETIKHRLGAANRSHAILLAIRLGFVDMHQDIPLPLSAIRGTMTRICYAARTLK